METMNIVLKHSDRHNNKRKDIPTIELKNLTVDFGETKAIDEVSIKMKEGELITLLGPSGCGKTTMLNAISGLLSPTSGKILFKGKDVTKSSPQKRKLGLVFQNYALYPHMNVYKNIAFPLQNDAKWQAGVKKKNDIAKLKVNSIILKANGATEAELNKLQKSFYDIFDVIRETEYFLNKTVSIESEEYNLAHSNLSLLKPRFQSAISKLNKNTLSKMNKIKKSDASRDEKSQSIKDLKETHKAAEEKLKQNFKNDKAKFTEIFKEVKARFNAPETKAKISEAKNNFNKLPKQAKNIYKKTLDDLDKKYSLKREKLSDEDLKKIEKISEKIISIKEAIHNAIMEVSKRVDIVKNLQKMPTKLSGGQQQRVAIARGIVKSPDILLMDEPLSNLDAKLRIQTRNWIRQIQQELKITLIFVTHDQEEAMSISDTVVLLNDGHIQQQGSPMELYRKPKNEFVAKFLGMPEMSVFSTEVSNGVVNLFGTKVGTVDKKIKKVKVGIRPEDFVETKSGKVSAVIQSIEYLGKEKQAQAKFANGETSTVVLKEKDWYEIGETVKFKLPSNKAHIFLMSGERI